MADCKQAAEEPLDTVPFAHCAVSNRCTFTMDACKPNHCIQRHGYYSLCTVSQKKHPDIFSCIL